MAVTVHRQRDPRMSGELLGNFRVNSARGKDADETVTQTVEVAGTTIVIDRTEELRFGSSLRFRRIALGFIQPSFSRRFQVDAKHWRGLFGPCSRK